MVVTVCSNSSHELYLPDLHSTGHALDAAMHGSGDLVFVAAVSGDLCGSVENELIWQGRRCLTYNNHGKLTEPSRRMKLTHTGTPPRMTEFEFD